MSDSRFDAANNGYDPQAWGRLFDADETDALADASVEDDGAQDASDADLAMQKAANDEAVAAHAKAWAERDAAAAEGLNSKDQTDAGITAAKVETTTPAAENQESPFVLEKPANPLSFKEAFKAARAKGGDDGKFEWTKPDGTTTTYSTKLLSKDPASIKSQVITEKAEPQAVAKAPAASVVMKPASVPQVTSILHKAERPNGQRGGAPETVPYLQTPAALDLIPGDENLAGNSKWMPSSTPAAKSVPVTPTRTKADIYGSTRYK